jgi:hypothetical protein
VRPSSEHRAQAVEQRPDRRLLVQSRRMGTLYEPPRRPLLPRSSLKGLLLAALLVVVGGYLYRAPPGWLTRIATAALEVVGHELVTVEVETAPVRSDVLLDGVRVESLPLHVRRDGAMHRITAVAAGYEPAEVVFAADRDHQLVLTLRPIDKPGRIR